MSTYKKFGIGLTLLVIMLTAGFLIPRKTFAATLADVQQCESTVKFVSIAEIVCTTSQGEVHFIDRNPTDTNPTLSNPATGDTNNLNYQPANNSVFCNPGEIGISLTSLNGMKFRQGISITSTSGGAHMYPSDAGKPIRLKLNIGYTNTATSQCTRFGGSDGKTVTDANTAGLSNILSYSGSGVTSLTGVNQGALSGRSYGQSGSPGSGNANAFTSGFTAGTCSGEVVIVSSDGSANRYELNSSNSSSLPAGLKNFLLDNKTAGCGIKGGSLNFGLGPAGFTILGTPPTQDGGGGGGGGGGDTNGDGVVDEKDSEKPNSCEELGGDFGLSWVVCPILGGIDSVVNKLNNIIEGQLIFNTEEDFGEGQEVKQAWSSVKNIATTLVVIAMLVMVISQAVSWGPFDAYTVRKMLPRLVVAVIVMQLSWELFSWTIELANDLGQGIAQILYKPFGGTENMSLKNLVGNSTVGGASALFSLAAATAVGVTAFILAPFGTLLIALPAVAGLFIAFLVLLVRKILIILCMVLVPIALASWILPGTQKYWKFWHETFSKLLLMFPLIIAVIASGRIFAYIAGQGTSNEGLANGTVIKFVMIIVGVFAPYWLLPKTFQWGGRALGNISGAINDRSKGLIDRPRKYASEQDRIRRDQIKQDRAARLAFGESRYPKWDKLLAGKYNIGKGRARSRQYEMTRARGREEAEKAAQEAVIGSKYEAATHRQKLDGLFAAAQGHEDATTELNGNNPAVRRWALDRLAEFGDWDAITNLRSRGLVDDRDWQAFTAKNISAIHQKAPHLSPLRPDLTELAAEDIPNWHNSTVGELEEQATHGVMRNKATGMMERSADPVAQRRRAVEQATRALESPYVLGRLTEEQRNALQRVRNLGGTELLAANDPRLASSARVNYGLQIGGGNLTPADQDVFEDNVLHIKSQTAASTQAREIYDQVVTAAHTELGARVQRAEQEAIAQGATPAQIMGVRAAAETAASADRARLVRKGLIPI